MGSETIVSPGGVRKLREDITSNTQAITSSNEQISKLSEGMTYVVVGDKSVETATIPVGSYVRLVKSNITGRSDGIYTVATAIPVNTVIDGTYFNESAPIPGGLGNALNSNLTTVSNRLHELKNVYANNSGWDFTYKAGMSRICLLVVACYPSPAESGLYIICFTNGEGCIIPIKSSQSNTVQFDGNCLNLKAHIASQYTEVSLIALQ